MKNLITPAEWEAIEEALMKAEIPYYVSFDSHVSENLDKVTYDKYIRVEPFVIMKEVKYDN